MLQSFGLTPSLCIAHVCAQVYRNQSQYEHMEGMFSVTDCHVLVRHAVFMMVGITINGETADVTIHV